MKKLLFFMALSLAICSSTAHTATEDNEDTLSCESAEFLVKRINSDFESLGIAQRLELDECEDFSNHWWFAKTSINSIVTAVEQSTCENGPENDYIEFSDSWGLILTDHRKTMDGFKAILARSNMSLTGPNGTERPGRYGGILIKFCVED